MRTNNEKKQLNLNLGEIITVFFYDTLFLSFSTQHKSSPSYNLTTRNIYIQKFGLVNTNRIGIEYI